MIGFAFRWKWKTKGKINHVKKLYNNCKAAFSAEYNTYAGLGTFIILTSYFL